MKQESSTTAMSRRFDDTIARTGGKATHQLPALPYAPDALEPAIDAHTMTLHNDEHHAAYVEKLNLALESLPTFRGRPASWLYT